MKNAKLKFTALSLIVGILVTILTACGNNYIDDAQREEYDRIMAENRSMREELGLPEPTSAPDAPTNENQTTAQIGDIIQFGGLDWRILDEKNEKILILSENVLEPIIFHATRGNPDSWGWSMHVTWEESDMREHLNNSFYNITFGTEEKSRIAETRITERVGGSTAPADVTTLDKIFLLSFEELNRYFEDRNSARIGRGVNGEGANWWLRSIGYGRDMSLVPNASVVYNDGSTGSHPVHNTTVSIGIRPALWLYLSENRPEENSISFSNVSVGGYNRIRTV
jgi:hypothetical protein